MMVKRLSSNPSLTRKVIILIVLALVACAALTASLTTTVSPPLKSEALPAAGTITAILISYDLVPPTEKYQTVHRIVDPRQNSQVVSFLGQYRSGWGHVIHGEENPTCDVNLDFYQGKKDTAWWGIDSDNFKAYDKNLDSLYRPVKREEVRHLLSLLKLKEGVVGLKEGVSSQ